MSGPGLEFENSIEKLESEIAKLERETDRDESVQNRILELRRELVDQLRSVYSDLDAWQTVQVSRHKNRPYTRDYLKLAFDEFVELHGDKHFGDDQAMPVGFAKLDRFKVMVVGHQKGRTYKERAACHFGCAHPEGYRKAMSKMRLAEKYGLPLICFID
ncbi:MAG: acetyl-CoA carboxylase carboxyl transferase subunit alpha, partial [Planctomycetota bacterium]